jgi:hypothetical protein
MRERERRESGRFQGRTQTRCRSTIVCRQKMSTLDQAMMWRGTKIASGAASEWKERRSETSRSTSNSSWRCGSRPLLRALENNCAGALLALSAWFMTSQPSQCYDDEAFDTVVRLIRETTAIRFAVGTTAD